MRWQGKKDDECGTKKNEKIKEGKKKQRESRGEDKKVGNEKR